MIRVNMPMSSISTWVNTIKEINTSVNRLKNICRRSNSHQISRLVLWKIWNCRVNDPIHVFMGFSHCQSSECITIQIKFRDPFRMFDADIFINTTLIDSKQHLLLVDRIFQAIQPCHLFFTALQPAHCAIYRVLDIVAVCHTGRTFIKRHRNRRC